MLDLVACNVLSSLTYAQVLFCQQLAVYQPCCKHILLSTCMPMHYMPGSSGASLVTTSHATLTLTAFQALLTVADSGIIY